jgi:hypothetical protein
MTIRPKRGTAAIALLAAATSFAGCGYILHPERRGNTHDVAGGPLAMDLLWLIPGIIPGVVALIVDFSSGAIYEKRGERVAVVVHSGERVSLRVPESAQPAQLQVRLVSSDQHVVASKTATVGPDIHGQTIELAVAAEPSRNGPLYLEVVGADGASARFPTTMELAP